MARIFINNPQAFMRVATGMVSSPAIGRFPDGYSAGHIRFSNEEAKLVHRKPLPVIDGSARTAFEVQERTYRAQIEGMSMLSREPDATGLIPEIISLEKSLGVHANYVFELSKADAESQDLFEPGFAVGARRFGGISIRKLISSAITPEGAQGDRRMRALAADVAKAALEIDESEPFSAEAGFVAGALYAALGGQMRDRAAELFVGAAWGLMGLHRNAAGAMVGEWAIELGGFDRGTGVGIPIGALVARAWLAQAMKNKDDKQAAMIMRSRGITAALASEAWAESVNLYRLEADSNSGRVERGKGYARALWAMGMGITSGHDSMGWEDIDLFLDRVTDLWKGSVELAEERELAFDLKEGLKSLVG